jgi:AbrB family looped-hinge helix DNA binding protein
MQIQPIQTEWVNILSKGIITIPKKMREQVGMKEGDVSRIRVVGKTIVIEPKESSYAEVRDFTTEQMQQWIQEDTLPTQIADKVETYWKDLP